MIIYIKTLIKKKRNLILHYGDVTDSTSVSQIIKKIKPHEIYNLAAQSHVAVSFEVPEYTANADAIGALRILEAIKFHNFEKQTKFYQAGTNGTSKVFSMDPVPACTFIIPHLPCSDIAFCRSFFSASVSNG